MKFGGTSVGDTREDQGRRAPARRGARATAPRRRRPLGDGRHDRRADPPRARDLAAAASARVRHAHLGRRADLERALRDGVHDLGHEAISLTGSQAGIVTDTVHGKAKIAEVRAQRINEALDDERIVLVAGFQGVSADSHDVTTLGRGGSNLTAVALAAALGATACEMYTDVEGVFTADPRLVPDARKLAARDLRGDARARGERREGAPATLGRVRAQPRRAAARALDVLRRRGNVDRRRGGSGAREGDHLRCRAHRLRAALPRAPRSTPRGCSRASPTRASTSTRSSRSRPTRSSSARRVEDRAACEELLGGARRRVVDARRPRQGRASSAPA